VLVPPSSLYLSLCLSSMIPSCFCKSLFVCGFFVSPTLTRKLTVKFQRKRSQLLEQALPFIKKKKKKTSTAKMLAVCFVFYSEGHVQCLVCTTFFYSIFRKEKDGSSFILFYLFYRR
jgi:hypothetical protein